MGLSGASQLGRQQVLMRQSNSFKQVGCMSVQGRTVVAVRWGELTRMSVATARMSSCMPCYASAAPAKKWPTKHEHLELLLVLCSS